VKQADLDSLTRLCRHYGANPPQDSLMARKLLERAGQIARSRDIEELEALQHLLSLMKTAREGTVLPDTAPQKGFSKTGESKKIDGERENH